MTDDETRPDQTDTGPALTGAAEAPQDAAPAPETAPDDHDQADTPEDAPPALDDGDEDPDALAGDLTDPDVDLSHLEVVPDEDGGDLEGGDQ